VAHVSSRITTDAEDTIYVTRWSDNSFEIVVVKKGKATEISLSSRDIDELSNVIHGHDESQR
jgi:hypothetical protein